MKHLINLGVRPEIIPWIVSFHSQRSQRTRYHGALSKKKELTCGLAQGTKLGPIVFIAHVNNLTNSMNSPSRAFVDDLNLVESRRTSEPSKLQNDLDNLSSWTEKNKMKLNPSKCKAVHICFARNPPPPPPLSINGHVLEFAKSLYASDEYRHWLPKRRGDVSGIDIPVEIIATYSMAHLVLSTDQSNSDDDFKIHFEALPAEDSACVAEAGRDLYEEEGEIICPRFYQTFCGSSPPPTYTAMSPIFGIYFHSDVDTSGTGFKLQYYVQDKSADDLLGYQRLHQLSEDTGTFSSMNYPHFPYRNHVYQHWNITVDTHNIIKLTFLDMDVEYDQGCGKDYVVVDDPHLLLMMTWCGTCLPPPYISAGHNLRVHFVTNALIRQSGFSVRYETMEDRPGTSWEVVGTKRFLKISVGRVGVWAIYDHSTVMYRVGTFGNEATSGTKWQAVPIGDATDSFFNFESFAITSNWDNHEIEWIHAGKNLVWITGSYNTFIHGDTIVRKGIDTEAPEGKSWEMAGAANMREISVSSRSGQLWAVEWSGKVWRAPFYCEVSEDEIVCPHSDKCIPECSVCDGIVDCGNDDDADERNCWLAACPEKHRRMCNGDVGCYSPNRVCDGEWNCGEDKEDERDCPRMV
ncbi:CUBN [Branchiostoma lanceolatum]|uniref:CUBN protein n=1 Tax=Branchiostoma lanceolatum TaxID=7740 RepID=A0A8K0EX69_BRALA|nr:CUBN [Branchiostoma lanceolatum]